MSGSEQLLSKSEILNVEVFKTKGIDPVVYGEADVLVTFNVLFSSAAREQGAANATDPEFYLQLTDKDGNIQKWKLYLGEYADEPS